MSLFWVTIINNLVSLSKFLFFDYVHVCLYLLQYNLKCSYICFSQTFLEFTDYDQVLHCLNFHAHFLILFCSFLKFMSLFFFLFFFKHNLSMFTLRHKASYIIKFSCFVVQISEFFPGQFKSSRYFAIGIC